MRTQIGVTGDVLDVVLKELAARMSGLDMSDFLLTVSRFHGVLDELEGGRPGSREGVVSKHLAVIDLASRPKVIPLRSGTWKKN